MAQSYIRLARFGGLPTVDGMKLARAAAQKALELDADQVIALDAMGWVQRTADWDWRGAQKTFQRALALAPGNAALLADAAILYFNTGRTDEAITLARSAVERDPLNAMAQINLGDLLWNAGRLPESIEELGKGIRLAPEVEEFRTHLAIAFAQLKRFPEAIATAEAEPNAVYRLFGLAYVAGLRGDRAASIKAREELVKKNEASMTGYVAMLYAVEGNRDEAFAWLDRAYRERDSSACWVKTAAVYAVLHGDPRWPELLRKLGLHDEQLK
jgi:tetratricopeptide (TPR) repeat protein